jgi:hypothetical protein
VTAATMQRELDHIGRAEAESGQGREKEFRDDPVADDANGAGGSLMGRNNQASAMSFCRDRHLSTIKEVPAGATDHGCVNGSSAGKARRSLTCVRSVPRRVFATSHEADSCYNQINDDGPIAREAIESNEGLAWQKAQSGLISNDHGESP